MRSFKNIIFLSAIFFSASVIAAEPTGIAPHGPPGEGSSSPPCSSNCCAALSRAYDDLRQCTSTVNNYSGGFSGAVPVQNCAKKLNDDLKTATSACQAGSPSDSSQVKQILDYLNNVFEPGLRSFITALNNKKSQFTAAGLKTTILNTLKETSTNVNAFSDSWITKTPSSQVAAAQAFKKKINDDFQVGITYYGS